MDLTTDRRPARSLRVRPSLRDQPAVAAQQRRRSNGKRPPARSRQQPAGGGEEDSIGLTQLGPNGVPAQHRQLVAEHHDLELLELVGSKAQRSELQNASEYEVAERPEQGETPPGRRDGRTTLRIRTDPTQAEPS